MKIIIVFTCGGMIPFQLHRPSRFYLAIELYERILQTKLGNRPCPIGYFFILAGSRLVFSWLSTLELLI
jgi:hypothetical protein